MSKIIAIDLGTTTSEVAYIKDGKPVIIKNDKYGDGTAIPSVVTIKEDEIVVGKKAKRQLMIRPECTIAEVKRAMGTDKKFNINGKEYIPEQISAMILRTLKEIAEEEIGEVSEAIITVPANFKDIHRTATKNAAAIAGLKVERIINEPTAAALGYGLDNMDKDANILVYDLGGGTFDCTVLDMFSGIMDVKASRGDNLLGGKDFDKKIEDFIIEHIRNNTSINADNLNVRKQSEIKDTAERAKKDLSVENSTEIMLNNFAIDENGDSIDIELELSRSKFEAITKELIDKTEELINETLEAAGLSDLDIDVVLAVGGSSRMRSVQELLKTKFGEKKIQKGINPDEAVALGAAVQAGIKSDEINSETGLIVTDACNNTLGIEVIGERFSPIIHRDVKLPCKASDIYYTVYNDQTDIDIRVYQGESKFVNDNILIGEFELTDIPMAPAGEERVNVTFQYDLNEMLQVSAEILSTGKIESRVMSTRGFSEAQINTLTSNTFTDVDYFEAEPAIIEVEEDNSWRDSELYEKVKIAVSLAEIKLSNLNMDTKNQVEKLLEDIKVAILSGNESLVESLDDTLTDLLFDLD